MRTLIISILAIIVLSSCQPKPENNQLKLWYNQPAQAWEEALPIGNGRIGGMVFGGPEREQIQFNEETLWTGEPHEYQNPGSYQYLDTIRQLLFEGKQQEAQLVAMDNFMSIPLRQKAYQPFGDLIIEMLDLGEISDYHRELDLNNGISRVQFSSKGYQFHREAWVSYPNQVMAVKLTVNEKKKLSFDIGLNSLHPESKIIKTNQGLKLLVKVDDGVLSGEALVWIHECDGIVEIKDDHLEIREASSVLVLMTAATTFRDYKNVDANPEEICQTIYSQAEGLKYKSLRKAHIDDYTKLFNRFEINFSEGKEDLPTNERILAFWTDPNDPSLLSLYAQYGRYLMITSSRDQGQPANLQGIWNPHLLPPWDSKWTVNINTEMNYWPAEATGLQECTDPLLKMIEECAETGKKVAREHYNARGWVLHHNTDIWRGAAPINASNHGIWVTGGAWLTTHMWEHYLFTQDETFLRDRAWPIMKGSAEFFIDYLTIDPTSGWLISGPSNSPENGGLVMGPTMDHQIIRTLFKACIQATDLLNIDKDFAITLSEMIPQIAPNQIGQYGQLQEWMEDIDNPNNKHRHVSHLWGVYPGNDITWDQPELMNAAMQSLIMRGDAGTGWSLAWKINFWSRFRDGNHTYKLIQMLLSPAEHPERKVKGGSYPNLFDAHPPFQIDGNFGGTAGIIEMLIQSQNQEIHLLPALPDALPKGEIKGVRARGGFILDFSWEESQLKEVKVISTVGGKCFLRYKNQVVEFNTDANTKHFFDGGLIQQ